MAKTDIPWAEMGWPLTSGCNKVSPGCRKCYACSLSATRLAHLPDYQGAAVLRPEGFAWTGKIRTLDHHLQDPLHWKKPRRVFVCHMADLFHTDIPWNFIYKAFETMLHCPQHTFMVLTKRAWRLTEVEDIWLHLGRNYPGATLPLPNVWGGVTVEDSDYVLRIRPLLKTRFTKRFISYEPALGPLDLIGHGLACPDGNSDKACGVEKKHPGCHTGNCKGGLKLDLVIAGCESGPRRRHAETAWFRDLRDQCQAAGVPYFLKQMEVNGKLVKMPFLDGTQWKELP